MNFAQLYIVTSKHITLALHSSFPGVRTRIQLNKIRFRKIYYNSQLSLISKCKIAKEVWDTLNSVYETTHAQTKMYYNKQLYALKMSEEDTMANHINTFRTLIDNLASAGTSINDKDSAIILLGTLPKSYKGLVSISSQSNETLESVTGLLLQEEI